MTFRFCRRHSGGEPGVDPVDKLPLNVQRALRSVLVALLEQMRTTLNALLNSRESAHGDAQPSAEDKSESANTTESATSEKRAEADDQTKTENVNDNGKEENNDGNEENNDGNDDDSIDQDEDDETEHSQQHDLILRAICVWLQKLCLFGDAFRSYVLQLYCLSTQCHFSASLLARCRRSPLARQFQTRRMTAQRKTTVHRRRSCLHRRHVDRQQQHRRTSTR